jgi:predicted molibdopterin-dependent oxidoreductase YjgC
VLKCEQIGLLAEPDGQELKFPKFRIEADNNPNRAGARLVLGPDAETRAARILAAARSGALKALYLVCCMPHYRPPPEMRQALARVPLLIVQQLRAGPLLEQARIVLPGTSFAEKDGVFVNCRRRAQLVRRAIDPIPEGWDDLAVLQAVLRGAGAPARSVSAGEVFREMTSIYPELAGLTRQKLGRLGVALGS